MSDLSCMSSKSEWVEIGQATQSMCDKYSRTVMASLAISQTSNGKVSTNGNLCKINYRKI